MEGKDDPDNRRDFPGGFPGDPEMLSPLPDVKIKSNKCLNGQSLDQTAGRTSGDKAWQLIDLFYDDETYVFARQDQ